MDVSQAVSGYITKMLAVRDGETPSGKMKILLLDRETVGLWPASSRVGLS